MPDAAMTPSAYGFCFIFNGIWCHSHLCVMGIPADLHIDCDSINRPGDLGL